MISSKFKIMNVKTFNSSKQVAVVTCPSNFLRNIDCNSGSGDTVVLVDAGTRRHFLSVVRISTKRRMCQWSRVTISLVRVPVQLRDDGRQHGSGDTRRIP